MPDATPTTRGANGRTARPYLHVMFLDVLLALTGTFLVSLLRSGGGHRAFGWPVSAVCAAVGLGAVALAALGVAIVGAVVMGRAEERDDRRGDGCRQEGASLGSEAMENDDTSGSRNDDALVGISDEEMRAAGISNDLTTPLLQHGAGVAKDGERADAGNTCKCAVPETDTLADRAQSLPQSHDLDLDRAKDHAWIDHTLSFWREGIFTSTYVILTALSFILGIEAVDLGNGDDSSGDDSSGTTITDVVYIALSLLTLQLTFFLTKSILTSYQSSAETLLDLRAVHVHPIRFDVHRHDAYCDICSEEIANGECFRCRLCDFDYCVSCYKRGRKVQDWAVLRGDGGVKVSPGADRRVGMGTYLLRSLGLLRPHALYVALTATCLLINVVCRLFVPNVEGGLFDALIEGNVSSFLAGVQFLAIYWAGRTMFQAVQRYAARLVSRRLRLDLRKKLFDRLLTQDVAFFDTTRAGAMSRRVDGDVEDMSRPIPILVNSVLQSVVLMVGALTCCLLSSFRLTVLSAASIFPVAYLTYVSAEWGGNLEGQMVACEEEGSAVITEAMANIRNVRALSAERFESQRYGRIISRLRSKMHREALGDMVVEILEEGLAFLVEVLVLAVGGMAIVNEHADALSVGQLIAFTMYWEILVDGVETIQDVFSDLAQAAGAAQRVFDLLDVHPDIRLEEGEEKDRHGFHGQIKFEDVRFAYQSRPEKNILNGFTLEVPAGGTCALVGRSGAGKTTLVHLLLRFYDPREGRITIDGAPLTDLNLKTFHDLIGFVSQDTKLFFGSMRDNLTYGLPWTPDEGEVETAAKAANCSEFIDEMEDGYDTNLGEAGVRLSGGQRQRLAIARAFLRRPRLLILDEATSHLDAENEQLVQESVDRLVESASSAPTTASQRELTLSSRSPGRCTVVVIAHRLSTVRNADVIAVVNEGRVAEQGSHDELLAGGGIYSRLVTKQAERAAEILPEGDGQPTEDADVDNLFDTVLGRRESSSSGSGDDSSSSDSSE